MAQTEVDPFDGYQPPADAGALKLNGVGDGFRFVVTEIGEPFDAEYGQVFKVTGEVKLLFGPTVEGPEVGEEGSFLLPYTDDRDKPKHVEEEWRKANKAAGRRDGSIRVGDDVAVRRDQDIEKSKAGKKFANPFRHHQVRVFELAALGDSSDTPW